MSTATRRASLWLVLVMMASLVLAACGGNTGGGNGGTTGGGTTTGGTTGGATAVATTADTPGGGSSDATTTAKDPTNAPAVTTATAPATSRGAGGTVAAQPCPDEAQGAQLQFWNPFTGPDGKFMTALVQQFSQKNGKGVNVKVQTLPEYYNKLQNAARSNTLPDVAIMHADQIPLHVARQVVVPMPQNVIEAVGVGAGDFPEAVWNAGEYNGQHYSIPLDIHPMVMYYNKQAFQKAGIQKPPTNREEYDQALQALKSKGGVDMAWSVTTGFPITQQFSQLLHQFGGSWFNEDGTQATWNSEQGRQALEYLKQAQTNYSKPNLPVDAGVVNFKQGKVGVEWNGVWQVTNLVTPHPFGAGAPVPQLGETNATWAGSHQFVIPKQRQQDAAKTAAVGCFISFISANSVEWAKAGQIPARNAVRESPAFQQVQPQASIAQSAEYAFFPPNVPAITEAFTPLDQAVATYMQKGGDPQQLLDRAKQQGDQILKANQQKYK